MTPPTTPPLWERVARVEDEAARLRTHLGALIEIIESEQRGKVVDPTVKSLVMAAARAAYQEQS